MAPPEEQSAAAYEKLGSFYLGRRYDIASKSVTAEDILYDSRDLTTHAVCIGMTGSGKTGLCTCLLEEAAIDGIPAIIIDPKGDMGNLLLSFPQLRPADFEPWVDPAEAGRKGQSLSEYAASRAELWSGGLAQWGQDGSRIRRLLETTEVRLFTPGSSAGNSLSVLRSFAAPPQELVEDSDAFREQIMTTVSGLLTLLGIDADPVKSREHILLSTILDHFWSRQQDLDIPALIGNVQEPPFDKVGVLALDVFYPPKDRMELMLTLNNLLASPGFEAWLQGDELDIARLLYSPEGKPRLSILYIAHLSDPERMFFVTLLLNALVGWMRNQPGTSSLRALLYMDEVFGYFPPVANPPSKQPMLTLLKQARAYGLGVVLATQNPVDLDYKGLANTGTWFLGRLQTERDKLRVLDGLEGIAGGDSRLKRQDLDNLLSSLDPRVFLLNNIHEPQPVLFNTRWALSFLRGPLTRQEIQRLTTGQRDEPAVAPPRVDQAVAASDPSTPDVTAVNASAAAVTPALDQIFAKLPPSIAPGSPVDYYPNLLATVRLHYVRRGFNIDEWRTVRLIAPLNSQSQGNPWLNSSRDRTGDAGWQREQASAADCTEVPASVGDPRVIKGWESQLADWLYGNLPLELYECPKLKLQSGSAESRPEFTARVQQRIREQRDAGIAGVREKYAARADSIRDRIETAQRSVSREQTDLTQHQMDTAISIGTTVLGAIFGRKAVSSTRIRSAGSAARKAGRTRQEQKDVQQARRRLAEAQSDLQGLDLELQRDLDKLRQDFSAENYPLEVVVQAPRKSDIDIVSLVLAWVPRPKSEPAG